jgi:hypothetical protein
VRVCRSSLGRVSKRSVRYAHDQSKRLSEQLINRHAPAGQGGFGFGHFTPAIDGGSVRLACAVNPYGLFTKMGAPSGNFMPVGLPV